MLKQWAHEGVIRLLYLDESGFERTNPLTYSYVKRAKQHRIPKASRRGQRISVLGFWQPQERFDYGMVVGGFNTKRYLKLMHWHFSTCQTALVSHWSIHRNHSGRCLL
jgi:putative transposase